MTGLDVVAYAILGGFVVIQLGAWARAVEKVCAEARSSTRPESLAVFSILCAATLGALIWAACHALRFR